MNVVIHLTESGRHVGRRLCLLPVKADGGRDVQAKYASLNDAVDREHVCKDCLLVWAHEAYMDGDIMPGHILELRKQPHPQLEKLAAA